MFKNLKKYNTLKLKYDVLSEELEGKILELNTLKSAKKKQQKLFDEKLKKLTEENIKLKEKLLKEKKNVK